MTPSFMNKNFIGYNILCWYSFHFKTWAVSLYCLDLKGASVEKLNVRLMGITSKLSGIFLANFRILYVLHLIN